MGEVHGPVVYELGPGTGPATGYTISYPCPRRGSDSLGAAPCAFPIGNGLFQPTMKNNKEYGLGWGTW